MRVSDYFEWLDVCIPTRIAETQLPYNLMLLHNQIEKTSENYTGSHWKTENSLIIFPNKIIKK